MQDRMHSAIGIDLQARQSYDAFVAGGSRPQCSALDRELQRDYRRLKLRRGSGVGKVAMARKLAVRMYWMLRCQASYAQLVRMHDSPWATPVQK